MTTPNIPTTIFDLEEHVNISQEMMQSQAYRSLADDAKIILLLMMQKKRPLHDKETN